MAQPSRIVLVTGAAGGIGAAITRALVGAGHAVAAVDCDAEALRRLAPSERIHPIIADLADEAACRDRSEEHTSELQSRQYLVCRLLLEKKTKKDQILWIDGNNLDAHSALPRPLATSPMCPM